MHQTVVLLHTLPDRSHHFDWLIDQPARGDERRLITFRCAARPDHAHAPFQAVRLPLHRAHYLDYQGPVSRGRGHVTRVAVGEIERLEIHDNRLDLTVRWDDRTLNYTARPQPHPEPASQIWQIDPRSPPPH